MRISSKVSGKALTQEVLMWVGQVAGKVLVTNASAVLMQYQTVDYP